MVEWRNVEGFRDFVVNEQGVIMNDWTKNVMKPRLNQQNLTMVNIWQDGRIYTRLVSLVVASAFVENENDSYNSVIHLNGDRSDCRAFNLMWRPRWYGLRYHRMFQEDPYRVGVYVPELGKRFYSLREFCTTYGLVEQDTYMALLNDEPCFHYGWRLERAE